MPGIYGAKNETKGNKAMTVYELTREQLIELKQHYMICHDGEEFSVSYDELLQADEIVPDETIFEYYPGVEFSEDDFSAR